MSGIHSLLGKDTSEKLIEILRFPWFVELSSHLKESIDGCVSSHNYFKLLDIGTVALLTDNLDSWSALVLLHSLFLD